MVVLAMAVTASVVQDRLKIPMPITLMVGMIGFAISGYPLFEVSDNQFINLVLLSLPLLLTADAMKLSWQDIKDNWLSLFYAAVILVILSVIFGALLKNVILVGHDVTYAFAIILFCMITPTDPITVSAIFSNFSVPHKLKVLIEGESLFNDASVLVMFGIVLASVASPENLNVGFISQQTVVVVFGSILIGVAVGYVGSFFLRTSDSANVETCIILLASYIAFWMAEHWHLAGILSIICAAVMMNIKIQKFIGDDRLDITKAEVYHDRVLLRHAVSNKVNHESVIKNMDFLSLISATILFLSMAAIIDIQQILFYWKEILCVFVASSLIRAIGMFKFAVLSNNVSIMQSVNYRWWSVMTFSGTKGAVSILMLHMIAPSFAGKHMLEAIVIGNIVLSIFIYSPILMIIFRAFKEKFALDVAEEVH